MKIITSAMPAAAVILLTAMAADAEVCKPEHHIPLSDIIAAQNAWGDGIVKIGASSDPKRSAVAHVERHYAYDIGPVLFKPTKAAKDQFRETREEALSYFVTGVVKEDRGFALAPYVRVRFENSKITTDCDSALTMGNYYFTDLRGEETKVEYTIGYVRNSEGVLKINLHHSSLPFNPEYMKVASHSQK